MPKPTKFCKYCGEPIAEQKPTRRLYCSDAHQQRAWRDRHAPRPRLWYDTFPPRSLDIAELALRRGVPLDCLILSKDERAVLVAACDRFSWEQREKALKHLADLFPWAVADGDELGLQTALLDALVDCWKECLIFSVPGSGVRWRRASWRPARWDWCLTLNAFLPWHLKKHHLRHEGDLVSLATDYRTKSRGGVSAWSQPRQALRCPSESLADPDLSEAVMEMIRRQIHPSPLAQRDHEGVMQVQTSTRAQDETLLRLARIEKMQREILDRVRVLPNETEVEEAVDQFLDDVGVKAFAEEIDLPERSPRWQRAIVTRGVPRKPAWLRGA